MLFLKKNYMAFDIDVIKRVYSEMSVKIDKARKLLGRPMKIGRAHV